MESGTAGNSSPKRSSWQSGLGGLPSISGRILMRSNSAGPAVCLGTLDSCSSKQGTRRRECFLSYVPESMSMVFSRTDKHMRLCGPKMSVCTKADGAEARTGRAGLRDSSKNSDSRYCPRS